MNRNPYTSGEVAHLVKYIAKYHPEVKGRLGTQLYKTLVEKVSARIFTIDALYLNLDSPKNGLGRAVTHGSRGENTIRKTRLNWTERYDGI